MLSDSNPRQVYSPNSELTPTMVVTIQLDALQNNDLSPGNRGIRQAWQFASPTNRGAVGAVERFIELVKNPLYKHLIGFETAQLGQVAVQNDRAQQIARLRHRSGKVYLYVFVLSRQREEPYQNCWMTDAVIPVQERV
ncbi:MAG: DUF4864 domain-containing protein [Chloroflexota bacterium]